MDQKAQNIIVVQEALQAVFTEHRFDQIDHYFAPDFVQHSPYAAPGGRDELKQWWAAIVAAIPDVTTTVEHPRLVADRIVQFAKLVGRENVIAGTDCGFAQLETYQRVHPQVMWAKLNALSEGARLASQELWGLRLSRSGGS